jgi:APA family basic amino acid/polyamine antiporter
LTTQIAVASQPESVSRTGLKRELGLGSATAIIAAQTIAIGIFLTPAAMAKSLGSPFLLFLVWLLMGAMTLCGALCIGALAARFPATGGIYIFLKETYGTKIAFLYGWMCLLVMDPGLSAALAIGVSSYIAYLLPLTPVQQRLVGVAIIVGLATLNVLGTSIGAGFLRWITGLKLAVLALLPIWAVLAGKGTWLNLSPFFAQHSGSVSLSHALPEAFVAAFFSFGGWWEISRIAGEVRDPERNLPRAMIFGTSVVTLVYLAVSGIFLYAVPLERVTSDQIFVSLMGEVLFGKIGADLLSLIVIVSVLSSLAAFMFAAPRVYFAMAKDGVFFPQIGNVHSRMGTPVYAILLQATLGCVLTLLGTFAQVIAYFIFSTLVFLGLTVLSVFLQQRKQPFKFSFGYPFTPAVFLFLLLTLIILLGINKPLQSAMGIIVIVMGIPVHRWFKSNSIGGANE